MFNKITLIGRVVAEPTVTTIAETQNARIRLVTWDSYPSKTKPGEFEKSDEFHSVVAWGKLAERLTATTGDVIVVDGKMTYREWEDSEGKKRYSSEVRANQIKIIQKKKREENTFTPNDEYDF